MRTITTVLALALALAAAPLAAGAVDADAYRRMVEADWLRQATVREPALTDKAAGISRSGVTAAEDAAGAVDGVKNGKWGFHTSSEKAPWWQVDLGKPVTLGRAVIYNRCDEGCAGRLKHFRLLVSDDGKAWKEAYRHDGSLVGGVGLGKPLSVDLAGRRGRFLRLRLDGGGFLHLDEVEVYAAGKPKANIALGRDADQSSASQWSAPAGTPREAAAPRRFPTDRVIERGRALAADLAARGVDPAAALAELAAVEEALSAGKADAARALYFRARRAVRELALANPLLDFDRLLLTRRVPSSYSHMSDQYYGWWSRPGGGLYVMEGFRRGRPSLRCLTDDFPEGSFLRPDVSHDGRRVLFAWCRYHKHVRGVRNKVDKSSLPADAFYHVWEMDLDSGQARQLTEGKYDDFDARYLPDGSIVFLSTRRGQATQCHRALDAAAAGARPDSYVRCGGGNSRPVAVYTLHAMDADGGNVRALSPFENFEWTPSLAADGRVLYARWDYVDRHNMPYMSLWSVNPDGTNPQAVYGNFTRSPHCIFEARAIPGSHRLIFTASGHHAITGGSLVLLDPDVARDGAEPITRLTPEVCFPEIEGWPKSYFANPFPLSEDYYLVSWSPLPIKRQGRTNAANALGVYLFDTHGNLELLWRDEDISTMYPLPIRPRPREPMPTGAPDEPAAPVAEEGRFVLTDVYQGLDGIERGTVKRLRVVAVPAKAQPQMNSPRLGVTRDDPGKCVLGTVPVEPDGSAYFRAPAGVILFFQALDDRGVALQTMRTVTYLQPAQTLSCIGCHEPRCSAPPTARPAALAREPSRLTVGPEGSWPLRFDKLVQPVLDRRCGTCHAPAPPTPAREDVRKKARGKLDLSPAKAYDALVNYGGRGSLREHVRARYNAGRSIPGECVADESALLAMFTGATPHQGVRLTGDDLDRLITWMDTYAQRLGSFSPEQEAELRALRRRWAPMLVERP